MHHSARCLRSDQNAGARIHLQHRTHAKRQVPSAKFAMANTGEQCGERITIRCGIGHLSFNRDRGSSHNLTPLTPLRIRRFNEHIPVIPRGMAGPNSAISNR
ncbi:hypothetical protein AFERRI_430012 [Acidithiobacillus ferrivorans]|uniref:Uncharacterized protein n=1 Tax=Acidithiobacillus ferrivorans TaxID=160808 RepID=A0A060UR59_9PROT|nr:hypothetical protein AFERRI_430012 [Acidithiobacillus ferrivorans]